MRQIFGLGRHQRSGAVPGYQRPLGGVQILYKGKRRMRNHSAPNADGEPEQVLQSLRWFASTELLTSDAVFEPMQGK